MVLELLISVPEFIMSQQCTIHSITSSLLQMLQCCVIFLFILSVPMAAIFSGTKSSTAGGLKKFYQQHICFSLT